MQTIKLLILALAIIALPSVASAQVKQINERAAANFSRACAPKAGNPTLISTSTTSAASAALTISANFYIVCTQDTHLKWGASAPTAVAAANAPLGAYVWFPFTVLAQTGNKFVAGILAAGTGTCYIVECE